jgi:hypothetical protein
MVPLGPTFSLTQRDPPKAPVRDVRSLQAQAGALFPSAPPRPLAGAAVRCTAVHRTRRFTTAIWMVRRCGNFVSREVHFRKRGPGDRQFKPPPSATPCRPDPRYKESRGSLSISSMFNMLAGCGQFNLHQRSGKIWDLELGPV